jgi:6-phosphogluconolactonase
VIHRDGGYAVCANYSSGVLTALPIDKQGRLGNPAQVIQFKGTGPVKGRQEQAHAHSFTFDREFNNGFACDLGSDRLMAYHFDQKKSAPLVPWAEPFVSAKPGVGPRHGVFHPSGVFAYFLNELDSSVDALKYSGDGFEKLQSISALPKGSRKPSTAAAIRISPDGKFLYTSNRGHDSIAVFKVLRNGTLEFVEAVPSGGKNPRDFNLDKEGNFLLALNMDSNNLVVFKVNHKTGSLRKEREYAALSPVSVIFR